MRTFLLLLTLLGACGDIDDDTADSIDVVVIAQDKAPIPTAASLVIECHLDGPACSCTMTECGRAALDEAARVCSRLRHPPVVE